VSAGGWPAGVAHLIERGGRGWLPAAMNKLAALTLAMTLTAGPAVADDAALGEKVFARCQICHQVGRGAETLVGPALNGLVGRPSGAVGSYPYSEAMRNAHLVWTPDELARFLKNPRQAVAGTKMGFAGLSKPDDVTNLIAYLRQFGPDGSKIR
jgi:cytochrome c